MSDDKRLTVSDAQISTTIAGKPEDKIAELLTEQVQLDMAMVSDFCEAMSVVRNCRAIDTRQGIRKYIEEGIDRRILIMIIPATDVVPLKHQRGIQ